MNIEKLTILFLLYLSFNSVAFSQNLEGRWISPENDFLQFSITQSKDSNYEIRHVLFSTLSKIEQGYTRTRYDYNYRFLQRNDTLVFSNNYYTYNTKNKNFYDEYVYGNFKILNYNDTLCLMAISDLSKQLFNGRDKVCFTQQELSIDKNIHFEKLIFYISKDFTSYIQIDNLRNVYFEKRGSDFYTNKKSYYYKGKLSKKQYEQMIHLLQTCYLSSLDWGSQGYSDTYEKVLIVYFNGKRKNFKSGEPSPISEPLVTFLLNIEKDVKVKKNKKGFTIEKRFQYEYYE